MDSDLILYNKKNVQVGSYTHWAESNPGQKKHVLIFDRDDSELLHAKASELPASLTLRKTPYKQASVLRDLHRRQIPVVPTV